MRLAPILFLALALAGCAGAGATGPAAGIGLRSQGGAEPGTAWQGDHSAVAERLEVVARSADDWRGLWARVGVAPPESLPDGRMAIALFLGARATGGYDISLAPATATASGTVVPYREAVPGPGDAVDQQPTSPFAIRLVDSTPPPVTFRLAP